MRHLMGYFLLALIMILNSAVAADQHAHGYLHNQQDSVWRDSQGDCIWTAYWVVNVPECESDKAPAAFEKAGKDLVHTPIPAEPKVVLETVVQFDFDRSELKAPARVVLDRLIEAIAQHDVRRIEIDGHTCSIGSEAYNQALSERRSASVQNYLLNQGVADTMIVTRGYGESRPAHSNDTRESRQLNRRAETRVFAVAAE